MRADTERIDELQSLTHGYGNGWVCRESSTGRGLRLHESEVEEAVTTIREAIDNYLDKGRVSMGDTHVNPNTNLHIQTTESAGVGGIPLENPLEVVGSLKLNNLEENTIVFNIDYGKTEVLKFCANGDILVYGRLAENDTEIVEGFREFLRSQNFLKEANMTNGFYNTDSINTKTKIKKFLDTAIKHSYNMVIQEKYRNGSSSREVRFDSSYAELLEEMLSKKNCKLGVIDRFLYNGGVIKSADGEVVLHVDWLFIYCHMSIPNLNKLVEEYKLELKEW